MDKTFQVIRVPVPVYHCDLAVFPAPFYYQGISRFFVLQTKISDLEDDAGSLEIEYIPGMVYCFLPSSEKR